MSIILREDVTYLLLEKLSRSTGEPNQPLKLEEVGDRQINPNEILLHLHYLTQWGYVKGQPEAIAKPGVSTASVESVFLGQVVLTQQGEQFYKRLMANSPHLAEADGFLVNDVPGFLAW